MEQAHKLSLDFVAGLIAGEGTFYWTKPSRSNYKIPCFGLRMHVRDRDLVVAVRDSLELEGVVHEYKHNGRHYIFLLIRRPDHFKNKIIPLIYPRLCGYKKEQFVEWFHKFGDPDVAENYKFIFNIFKKTFPELYIKNNLDYTIDVKSNTQVSRFTP